MGRSAVSPLDLEALYAKSDKASYADFVASLFDFYAQREGKDLAGEKTPSNVRLIPVLHELWPKARFLHLIRDGRDVCMSILNWRVSSKYYGRYITWKEDSVTTSAIWWSRNIEKARKAALEQPGHSCHGVTSMPFHMANNAALDSRSLDTA